MYIIEHAFLNLGKNKGRNIMLGAIIFAIITTTVVALAIFNTTGIILDETRAALQSAVRIAPQRQTMGSGGAIAVGGGQQEGAVSLDQYLVFSESELLDGSEIKESNQNADGVDAVYYLKQPDMLAAFETELRNKGLPDDYMVRTDESAFESVASPVESLQKLALTFLIIVLVLGSVIMVLLSGIAVRERKYEIGVLRAMGMKKKNVALVFWTEVIVITCICYALGLGIGTLLSQPVSDAITTKQAQTASTGSTSLSDRLSGMDKPAPEIIDITVSRATALQILGISVLLASIAGMVSVSRITKYEPIKILMEVT